MHPLIYDWNGRQPAPAGPRRDARRRDAARRAAVAVGAHAGDRAEDPDPAPDRRARHRHRRHRPARRRAARRCATSSGWRARSSTRKLRGAGQLRRRARWSPTSSRSSTSRSAPALPIECCTFIGSSPIRQYAEDWTLDRLLRLTEEAVTFAVRRGPARDVRHRGHDARRSRLAAALYSTAIRAGATPRLHRGHRGPRDAGRRARPSCGSCRSIVDECGGGVGIDWHGHRDRDLAVENSLAAMRGRRDAPARRGDRHRRARRQHADGRAARQPRADGRTSSATCRALGEYCAARVARRPACRSPRTIRSSAATRSAPRPACTPRRSSRRSARSDRALVDAVYSGVPASLVGREQDDRNRPDVGPVERRLLAREARPRGDRRRGRSDLREGERRRRRC